MTNPGSREDSKSRNPGIFPEQKRRITDPGRVLNPGIPEKSRNFFLESRISRNSEKSRNPGDPYHPPFIHTSYIIWSVLWSVVLYEKRESMFTFIFWFWILDFFWLLLWFCLLRFVGFYVENTPSLRPGGGGAISTTRFFYKNILYKNTGAENSSKLMIS